MRQGLRIRAKWVVLLALLGPLVIVGAITPNFKQYKVSASPQTPIHLTSSPRNLQAFSRPLAIPPVITDSNVTLRAQEADVQILDGAPTRLWTYNGIFPGPTIRRSAGQTTQVTLFNNLPAAGGLSLHHHGAHTTTDSDGQPASYPVAPGTSRSYTFNGTDDGVSERGAMHWYHDHTMDMTGHNVWMGLAGMYLIDDPADPQTLPSGEFDVPLMIMDKAFDANNQLIYQFDQNGVEGDTLLVNGVVQPFFQVGTRKYRLRVLNASNFSDLDLELSNGQPLVQIGTESGLLPAPVSRQHILLGPAERADIVVDFAGELGQNVVLLNRAGEGTTADVMQFRVTQDLTDNSVVPATLRPLPDLGTPVATRTFSFGYTNGHWTINGQTFDPNRVDAQPVLGTTERWVLQNTGGWNHVVHIHFTNQQLLSRNGNPPEPYELTKESWYLSPGDTVEILIKFSDYTGRFIIHCHLLEHEDDSMMAQFEVVAPATPSPTSTATSTPTPSPTAVANATDTPTPITLTPTLVASSTSTQSPTSTPSRTSTATVTLTPTQTPTVSCPSPTPTTAAISIVDFAFNPQVTTITQGSTVRWTNTAGRTHTSTSDTGLWNSGNISPGLTFSRVFATAGTFSFHCNIHPNMTGTINVIAPVCPTGTPTTVPAQTSTPTGTSTPTPSRTSTFTPTSTLTAVPTASATFTNTPTVTPTVTAGSLLVGHVTWQGPAQQPSTSQQLPVTLSLCASGTVLSYTTTTDSSGYFTITTNLPASTLNWRAKGAKYLSTSGTLSLSSGTTQQEMGLQRAGDLDTAHNNLVNTQDFNQLRSVFGLVSDVGDLNNDAITNVQDLNLLKGNFGVSGSLFACP